MKRSHLLWLLFGASILAASIINVIFPTGSAEPLSPGWIAATLGGALALWLFPALGVWGQRRNPPRIWPPALIFAVWAFLVTFGHIST